MSSMFLFLPFAVRQFDATMGDPLLFYFYGRLSGLLILASGFLLRQVSFIPGYLIPILCLLLLLDTFTFAFITKTGHYSNSEIGLVAS